MEISYRRAREIIFKEGDPGDAMYIIMQGKVEMLKRLVLNKDPVKVW